MADKWTFKPDARPWDLADEDVLCPRCGYNLRAHVGPRCPECGRPFDPQTIRQSHVPWALRRDLGWFRAFWMTVRMKPRRLWYEVVREQDVADARKFSWVAVAHLAAVALLVAIMIVPSVRGQGAKGLTSFAAMVWTMGLSIAGGVLFTLVSTPSVMCAMSRLGPEARRRVTALAYYFFPVPQTYILPVCLAAVSLVLERTGHHVGGAFLAQFAVFGVFVAGAGRGGLSATVTCDLIRRRWRPKAILMFRLMLVNTVLCGVTVGVLMLLRFLLVG